MANLRRLPPGTLPPGGAKIHASTLLVCLITLKGERLNETQLRDLGSFTVRNQVPNIPGASVPVPFGGKYRQIMVYVDPVKRDGCVRSVNDSNLPRHESRTVSRYRIDSHSTRRNRSRCSRRRVWLRLAVTNTPVWLKAPFSRRTQNPG